jgi:hypothetical protein
MTRQQFHAVDSTGAAGRSGMVKHLPGEPVDGQQRCVRCQLLLAEYGDEDLLFESATSLFFRPLVALVAHDGYLGKARTSDADVPDCEPRDPADAQAPEPGKSQDDV